MKEVFHSLWSFTFGRFGRKTGTHSINSILNQTPIWIDLGDSWHVFREIPHLGIVLGKKAELVSYAKITVVDMNEDIVDNAISRNVLSLLMNPNPLQSGSEFLYQYSINRNLMGSSPIYKLKGREAQQIPNVLWVIPSDAMEVIPTGKLYNQSTIEGIIKEYRLLTGDGNTTFRPDEIIFKNQGNTNDVILGENPLEGLRKAISNIAHGLGMVNVVYTKKGAIGILSSNNKDLSGGLPMSDTERKKITEQYLKDYGTDDGKMSVIITNAAVKWQHTSYPLKDLEIHPEIEQDFGLICDRFGVDRDVFSSTKGATFENKKNGEIKTIQGSVKQEIDDLMDTLSVEFGLIERGMKLQASYDHLPVMKKSKKEEADANKANSEAMNTAWLNGSVTRNDIRISDGREPIDRPEMNMYIWETNQQEDE